MKLSICAAASALVLAACGGGTGIGPSGTIGGSDHCSVTLTGAQTGTYDCKSAIAVWDQTKNETSFVFSVSEAGTTPQILVVISFKNEPHSATYASTDTGVLGGATVYISGGSSGWTASSDPGSPQGSFSLKFTGVLTAYTASNGKTYSTAGSLDATLPATSGSAATGTVILHATF